MKLGAFSVSLTVKDIERSIEFYEALGFEVGGGAIDQGWCILRSDSTTIGLFHGMFDKNMMTFNPGWAQDTTPLDDFEDVRSIQARLKEADVFFCKDTEPGTGPAHIIVQDPDGNIIMLDQHVNAPGE